MASGLDGASERGYIGLGGPHLNFAEFEDRNGGNTQNTVRASAIHPSQPVAAAPAETDAGYWAKYIRYHGCAPRPKRFSLVNPRTVWATMWLALVLVCGASTASATSCWCHIDPANQGFPSSNGVSYSWGQGWVSVSREVVLNPLV